MAAEIRAGKGSIPAGAPGPRGLKLKDSEPLMNPRISLPMDLGNTVRCGILECFP